MNFIMKCFLFPYLFLIVFSCSEHDDADILARVADKEITMEEFLNRAEMTPRPSYCNSGQERDKRIVLNTLITEKLFALEEKSKSSLINSPLFKAFIQGRKEQYMREELLNRMALTEKDLDPAEIDSTFKLAGFVYDVEFYNPQMDDAIAFEKNMLKNPELKDSLFNTLKPMTGFPRHLLKYDDPEFPSLHHTLFSKEWRTGDIIGPVRLRETKYMVLKIKNVFYEPVPTQTRGLMRRVRVKERLLERENNIRWNKFIARLMKGKQIQFVPEITTKVAELWAEKLNLDKNISRDNHNSDKYYATLVQDIDFASEKTMFIVDDESWTVIDFKKALSKHPLVFRKPDMGPNEFIQQFRLAIVDLIQDHFITKEAYRQNIDKLMTVQRKTAMWEDSYLALEHRGKLIASQGKNNTSEKGQNFHELADPYIQSFNRKYKDKIEINIELLKKLKLTHTDITTVQQFVPYNQIVPGFPILTKDDKLVYGSVLN